MEVALVFDATVVWPVLPRTEEALRLEVVRVVDGCRSVAAWPVAILVPDLFGVTVTCTRVETFEWL